MSDIEKNRHNWDGPVKFEERQIEVDEEKPKIVDLFCGAGGISEGFKRTGFEVVFGCDIHEPSIETFRENHPEASTILGDMRKVSEDYLKKGIGDLHIDVMAAGIPCQGFSLSNKKRSDEDERNYLFLEYMDALDPIDPDFVLIENVENIKNVAEGRFVEDIERALKKKGYCVEHKVLSAENFGVPQRRRRLFFFGSKKNKPTIWPKQSFSENGRWTVGEAIGDLPSLEAHESADEYDKDPCNEYQREMRDGSNGLYNHEAPHHQESTVERIKNTDPGEPMYDRFKQRVRLDPQEPSPTLVAGGIRPQFLFGHPNDNRGLTVRERARLQSFPDSYKFKADMVQSRVLTGNAVPPKLSESFGNSVKNSKKGKLFRDELLKWWKTNKRELPWREEDRGPFDVFVAEMLLRKTRAEKVEEVYEEFLSKYPSMLSIHETDEENLKKDLKPLGLQSERAKGLKQIAGQLYMRSFQLPKKQEELIDLPHVGRYIANATLCFGHNKKMPIVDANVSRILEEVFDIKTEKQLQHADYLWEFVESLLPEDDYRDFNLALLDLGARMRKGDKPDFLKDKIMS